MPHGQFRDMSETDRRSLVLLGAAIRIARHRMALTQRQLAERSGVSQTAISRMECGKVWGMAIVRFARVAWALEEGTPLGGCPHPHLCDYGTRWRQVMAEQLGPIGGLQREEALRALGADALAWDDEPDPAGDRDRRAVDAPIGLEP